MGTSSPAEAVGVRGTLLKYLRFGRLKVETLVSKVC